jgi:hypothetical protein
VGNRSKYVAFTVAAAAAVVMRRRRSRLRAAARGIRNTILPTAVPDATTEPLVSADDAHAPGHRHLAHTEVDDPGPVPLRSRPWTKHAHGMGHPFSGN